MFWAEDIPHAVFDDGKVAVSTVAGQIDGMDRPPTPPPESWAHDPSNEVAIWTVAIAPEGSWVLPTASQVSRNSVPASPRGPIRRDDRFAFASSLMNAPAKRTNSYYDSLVGTTCFALSWTAQGVTRSLFLFTEGNLQVGSRTFRAKTSISLDATVPTRIANVGKSDLEVLILQGKPIAEPVAQVPDAKAVMSRGRVSVPLRWCQRIACRGRRQCPFL